MHSIKTILVGIIFILAALFCMGVCILNAKSGGPELLTICLFVIGLIISVIGLFQRDE